MVKKGIYAALIIFEVALGLAYGLLLKSSLSVEFWLIIAFTTPFVVLYICSKTGKKKAEKLIKVFFVSLLLMAVAIGVFSYGNRVYGKFVDEYDVVVDFVNGRGGGYAEFTNPQGKDGSVDLHDYRLIIFDDDFVDVGDTIRVREYKGVFDETYYTFVEEKH